MPGPLIISENGPPGVDHDDFVTTECFCGGIMRVKFGPGEIHQKAVNVQSCEGELAILFSGS